MLEQIKVGGIKYEVVKTELFAEHESDVLMGRVDYYDAVILINEKVNIQKQEQTLVHELMHAIIHEAGIQFVDDDDDQEEAIVTSLANILHQVLQDNDFSYLHYGEKPIPIDINTYGSIIERDN